MRSRSQTRAERRAAPKPARASRQTRLALWPSMLAQASMEPRPSFPLGAEPGHEQPGGLFVSGEGQGLPALRGLQGRPTYPSDEGLSCRCPSRR